MSEFVSIDVFQAKDFIKLKEVAIVDIRDQESYSENHIEGATRVGAENIQEFLQNAQKEKPLVCYCYHGISSQDAAQFFKANGFQEVYTIVGGFEEWRKEFLEKNKND